MNRFFGVASSIPGRWLLFAALVATAISLLSGCADTPAPTVPTSVARTTPPTGTDLKMFLDDERAAWQQARADANDNGALSSPAMRKAYDDLSKAWQESGSREAFQERARIIQDSVRAEAFATLLRYVPIYDESTRQWITADTYLRDYARENGVSDIPLGQDPVGAAVSIFMDPSSENISRMLGLGQ